MKTSAQQNNAATIKKKNRKTCVFAMNFNIQLNFINLRKDDFL